MPVSKYDNPAQYNPINTFQSEYVPLPFEEINHVLASKQKKADDQKLDIQNRSNSLNIPTIREHEQDRQKFVNQYNNRFMELLDSGIDPTSGEFVRKKKEILDELASDYRPGVFKRSVDAYKQQQEYTQKLRQDGKYGGYNDPYSRGFQGRDETGRVNEYQFKSFDPTEDRVEPVLNFFKNAKPSGYEKDAFELDNLGNIVGIKNTSEGYKGIGEKFIARNAQNYLAPFIESKAGKDFSREMLSLGYTPEEIPKLAFEHIKDLGQVFIHGESKKGSDFDVLPEYAADGLKAQDGGEPVSVGATAQSSANIDKMKVVLPSQFGKALQRFSAPTTGVGATGYVGGDQKVGEVSPLEDKDFKFTPQQDLILAKAKKKYGGNPTDNEGKGELINKYLDDFAKEGIQIPVIQYSDPKVIEAQNKIFFSKDQTGGSAAINRPFKLISGEGNTELTGNDFLTNFSDRKGYTTNVTGNLTPDNPYFSAGKQVTVLDENGKAVAVYAMEGNRKEINDAKFKHQFYKAKYNPDGRSTIKAPDGKTYHIDYEPVTSKTLYDKGRPVKEGEIARLLDDKGNVIAEVQDPENAIDKLYESIK
jgi:hypothetical protein